MALEEKEHWLARYANNYHTWKVINNNGSKSFTRPLGLVELSFDIDGTEYGGRADLNALLKLEINHASMSKEAIRRRIVLAWTSLRLQHPMLMSCTTEDMVNRKKSFLINVPSSIEEALQETLETIVWVDDHYDQVDSVELYRHCMNAGRIIEPEKCLSKVHVLPLVKLPNGNYALSFLIVLAHQISDGLSAYNWYSHLIRILNMPQSAIERELEVVKREEEVRKRLPPAQEDLYPIVATNKARERWFWAIIRILRHVRKTLPPTFPNPLRREEPLKEPTPLPPCYTHLFNYSPSIRPPTTSAYITATLSPSASARMISLCRSTKVSIGAGCFALAGLSMMQLHETLHPNIPAPSRLPFTASFPVNPRAFFSRPTPPESCMLSFSEGIVMPFLSLSLPIEARFKLVAKHANRELRMYQKRGRGESFDQHSPGRLLANGYLFQTERVDSKAPPHRQRGVNPQGLLPANIGKYGATCGVSSVGSTAALFKSGTHELDKDQMEKEGKDFAADFRNLWNGVRAREGEFLVGSSTDEKGSVHFAVSYDAGVISEEAAGAWKETVEAIGRGWEG
jgi:hypothetical protein